LSLKLKIFSTMLVLFLSYILLDFCLIKYVIYPGFQNLEYYEAKRDFERCRRTIDREIHHLDSLCNDWAAWDDTYDFIIDKNKDYIDANLVIETFQDSILNVIYYFDNNADLVWGKAYNLKTMEPIELEEIFSSGLKANHYIFDHKDKHRTKHTIINTAIAPMLFSSRPILNSKNKGPVRGTLIMGRFLNTKVLNALKDQIRVNFALWPVDKLTDSQRILEESLGSVADVQIRAVSNEFLHVYGCMYGIDNKAVVLIRSDFPRNISLSGRKVSLYALISIFAVGILVIVFLIIYYQKTVIGPILKLTEYTKAITEENGSFGDSKDVFPLFEYRKDEIGVLAGEFESMMEKLNIARKNLTERSYMAGMAEMASGILHNVRNVLSPLIGEMDIMKRDIKNSSLNKIDKAWIEVLEGEPDGERKANLKKYIDISIRNLPAFENNLISHLTDLLEKSKQMEKFLSNLESFSKQRNLFEAFIFSDMIHESVKLVPKDKRKNILISVNMDIQKIGTIYLNRITLVQVIGNLLINACESFQGLSVTSPRVSISAYKYNDRGCEKLHITVSDNGVGISRKDYEKIFKRGFSSKKKGSTGIGLHWCSNVVNGMHGKIYVESDGPGRGSTFHIRIPCGI
jgi:two-component system, NtrC family, sensor kinase